MESTNDAYKELDGEFDKFLADMKPYVLKLPLKSERQRCAVWIKKLCETQPVGFTERKTRNLYCHVMLHMLRQGIMDAPFDKKPPDGSLPPLPSSKGESLPDWVAGELTESVSSSVFGKSDFGNPAASSTWLASGSTRNRPHSVLGISLERDRSASPSRHDNFIHNNRPANVSLVVKVNANDDWWKSYQSTSSSIAIDKALAKSEDIPPLKTADREVQMRIKMMESKFHEEKLWLQQKHDAAVQKILDRKNAEIEDVKNVYKTKAKDLEETISKLERKIQILINDSTTMRETKDKQLAELRKVMEESNTTGKIEMDKKLHEALVEFEQEKFDLQRQHTKNIQEILDETNVRLQKMEQENSHQTASTAQVIADLENRVHQLTLDVDNTLRQHAQLENDKSELNSANERLRAELQDISDRYRQLEREHQNTLESQEQEMRNLKNKTEASLEYLKQEHNLSSAKASDTIDELERDLDRLKRGIKESEEQRQRQIRELEQLHQQDKIHIENLHDKQIRSLKKEMEQLEEEFQKKIKKLEMIITEKDLENSQLLEANRDAVGQAERALEEFRQQVEHSQSRVYDELKQQMHQVDQDLKKSKHARERQAVEFSRQLEEEKFLHEKEVTEMKMVFENEKAQLIKELHHQKEFILAEHEKDMDKLKAAHRFEIQEIELRMRERQERSQKNISEQENQLRDLREELVQANQLRKQQLVELGLLREEEKQKMQCDHEAEISHLRTEFEQEKLELHKAHSIEMEGLLEKTNSRLKGIEKEYGERGLKSTEAIAELQATVNQLRGEIKRMKTTAEKKASELTTQYEEDIKTLRHQHTASACALHRELEKQRELNRNLERKFQKADNDAEEKINLLGQTFEDKMKRLMPAELRQELEDTIEALKSQVVSLQQRAEILQDELDARMKNPLAGFGIHTSSPIKSK